MSLTPKQEKFAQLYIQLGNASEAYRQSYDAEKMKPDAINVKACELLKNGKVSVRVAELQQALQKRHEITVDDIVAELEQARSIELHASKPNTSSMVAASMGKAKVLGLIKDKAEISGPDGTALHMTIGFVGAR